MAVADWLTTDAAPDAIDRVRRLRTRYYSQSVDLQGLLRFKSDPMPQARDPNHLPINDRLGGSVSNISKRPGAVKQGDVSAAVGTCQKLQPAGSTAAEIANELNNLLAIIIGNAELLKEVPDSPKHTRYMSDYILKAAERGSDLAKRLQALSRH